MENAAYVVQSPVSLKCICPCHFDCELELQPGFEVYIYLSSELERLKLARENLGKIFYT